MRHFNHKHSRKYYFLFLLIPILFLGVGAVVMLLWNAILPAVLHVQTITYLQALGILILSKILFGGFRHGFSRHHGYSHHKWHNLREKWESMSDEEKAQYKEKLKNFCHFDKP